MHVARNAEKLGIITLTKQFQDIVQARQADASASCDEAKALTLCFSSQNDALDFAGKLVEDGNGWLTANNIDFVERYRIGELYLVLKVTTGAGSAEYDFVFFSVPSGERDTYWPSERCAFHDHTAAHDPDGSEQAVFVGRTEAVHGPEEVIPSFVCLERGKERSDIRRQIFAAPFNDIIKISGGSREGKISILGVSDARSFGGRIASLVKGRSKIVDRIGSNIAQGVGNGLGEFDFMRLGDSIRLGLDNRGGLGNLNRAISGVSA
jgi:hypothetical protein